MWRQWFSWKSVISRVARAKGFMDPIAFMAQIQRFAKPSEVAAPVELIRLSTVLQARGIMNSQAIQHNLDWVWPYWVVRQFNPNDISFVPRAFSITHINMTQRNWTAVGLPDSNKYVLVDPRGLVTPHYDGWSLDAWILPDDGDFLIPSQLSQEHFSQQWTGDYLEQLESQSHLGSTNLNTQVSVMTKEDELFCQLECTAQSQTAGWLAISLRPYNPEGVSFIHKIVKEKGKAVWKVNAKDRVLFHETPQKMLYSAYADGDVYGRSIADDPEVQSMNCTVGMATAMALYRIEPGQNKKVTVEIPLGESPEAKPHSSTEAVGAWSKALEGVSQLSVPDSKIQSLYDNALRSVILHTTQEDVYPGPYTYKHFWFRDAVFILHAMLCVGLTERATKVLNTFPKRQRMDGYFCSQNGEWDSNGQVLWLVKRFQELTQTPLSSEWKQSVRKAAHWIQRKRSPIDKGVPHSGLLPSGFSAEHLGPNDYYFWDDFWSVAGLEAAAALSDKDKEKQDFLDEAQSLRHCIDKSLAYAALRLNEEAMPSSPYRRMDSGAIGSLAVAYPLQLWPVEDSRIHATMDYLWKNCRVHDGFYHDMSHSGINPYLTLHMAQVFMQQGDERSWELVEALADMASPTGQWPEAIHPQTLGGCMGDGQHVWASAEWLQLIRNAFVREEQEGLVLLSGIPVEWVYGKETLFFGPAPTPFGPITIQVITEGQQRKLKWKADWKGMTPELFVKPLGSEAIKLAATDPEYLLEGTNP